MKKTYYLTIIAVIIILSPFCAVAANWELVSMEPSGSFWFYDTESIIHEGNTLKVWVKIFLSDKQKAKYIKQLSDEPGIENVGYTMQRIELNCSRNTGRLLSITFYSAESDSIASDQRPDKKIFEIAPDTIMATLMETICKKKAEGK